MTGEQYKAHLERLGINQNQAATLLGVHYATSRKYACGTLDIPETIARLLSLMTVKRAGRILQEERK